MQKESLSFFCTLLNLSSLREDKLWPSAIIMLFCLNFVSLFRFLQFSFTSLLGKSVRVNLSSFLCIYPNIYSSFIILDPTVSKWVSSEEISITFFMHPIHNNFLAKEPTNRVTRLLKQQVCVKGSTTLVCWYFEEKLEEIALLLARIFCFSSFLVACFSSVFWEETCSWWMNATNSYNKFKWQRLFSPLFFRRSLVRDDVPKF